MDNETLWAAYYAAARTIADSNKNGSSAPLAGRRNYEQNYGLAYKALVQAGLAPQIRRKYRVI